MSALERESAVRKPRKHEAKVERTWKRRQRRKSRLLELLGEDASEVAKPGKSNKGTLAEADGLLSNALAKVKTSHESRPMKDSDDEDEEWQKYTPRLF
jgi:hypothetical protein